MIDACFSRVGAADDLGAGTIDLHGEMVETAAILNQATPRSLVILDEIGRGTATYDGLSIAWATLEHLHEVNTCRTLFATHYHELTALAGAKLPALFCATMKIKEWEREIIFLHQVAPGTADRSYGIHVAQMAVCRGPCHAGGKQSLRSLRAARTQSSRKNWQKISLFFSVFAAKTAAKTPDSALESAICDLKPMK